MKRLTLSLLLILVATFAIGQTDTIISKTASDRLYLSRTVKIMIVTDTSYTVQATDYTIYVKEAPDGSADTIVFDSIINYDSKIYRVILNENKIDNDDTYIQIVGADMKLYFNGTDIEDTKLLLLGSTNEYFYTIIQYWDAGESKHIINVIREDLIK